MSANGPIYDFVHSLSVEQLGAFYSVLLSAELVSSHEILWGVLMGEVEECRSSWMDSVL